MLETDMAAAYRDGKTAVAARKPRSANPHNRDATDARERVLALMWGRGWSAGSPIVLPGD